MSVYIKGMEMPKSCFNCYWRCKVDPENLLCRISGEYFEESFSTIEGRHKSCPLIPVPDHGRLIDADEADSRFTPDFTELSDFQCGWNAAMKRVCEDAPTVIEAEEGET